MDQSFQIREFLLIFKKRIKFLIFVPLFFAITGVVLSYYVLTPVYEARSDLLVNHTTTTINDRLSATDIEMNLRLIETYQFIIGSERIREKVSNGLEDTYTSKALNKKLRIETNNDSQIISLYVEDHDPEMATEIVNLFATTFQSEITELMNMNNVSILTEADVRNIQEPIRPKPILYIIIAYLIGFIFSSTYIFLSAYFNTKISTRQDVEKYLALPFLGAVGIISANRPDRKKRNKRDQSDLYLTLISRNNPATTTAFESYRTIRTNIQFRRGSSSLKVMLVTSTDKNEGKTVTSGNLAVVMAMDNKKTIVVDADLRKSDEHVLAGSNKDGLTNYLAGHATIDDILLETSNPNLTTVNSGPIPPNPAELLSSDRMDHLLIELKERFDMIIIDSPPLFFSDPAILATKVDGCLFVAHSELTKVTQAQQAIDQLKNVNASILGVVLNRKKERKDTINYYDYG